MRTALLLILVLISLQTPAQTVKKQRLVAVFRHLYNSTFVDTTFYSYSGDRGITEFKPYAFNRDYSSYGFDYGNSWSTLPAENMPEPVADLYDENIFPDVVIRKAGGVPSSNSFDTIYQSYEKNNITEVRLRDIHTENTFNSANRLVVSTYTSPSAGGKRVIAYDEQQRVKSDTSLEPNGATDYTAHDYAYNADGTVAMITISKIDLGEWKPIVRFDYTYNAAKNIAEFKMFHMMTQWANTGYEIFTYDNESRFTGILRPFLGDTTIDYHLIYSNNSKLADTLIRYQYDMGAVAVCYKTSFYYNSFGNPDSAITQAFASCITPTPDISKTYYKYETYEVDTTGTNSPFVIYPNPADKQITIRWSWKQPTEPVYMQVYNAIGREMLRNYLPKANKTEKLDISSFPPGVYILRIRTESGKKVHTEKLVIY